jgi:hypothetical protein
LSDPMVVGVFEPLPLQRHDCRRSRRVNPDFYLALVHTSFLLLDVGEGVAEAGWRRVFGGEGVAAGAVAAGGAGEFLDGPAGAARGEPRDGQGGRTRWPGGPRWSRGCDALGKPAGHGCDVHHSDPRLLEPGASID